jgi:lipopolysaccharide transport system ATP-binding protein
MSDSIITVENLSKRYLVGHQSAKRDRPTTFREMLTREARNFVRKADDLVHGRQIVQGDSIEEFWALRKVSFEVRKGEVIGIVGRNGAGKSTLLKILSRITEPTEGRVLLRGRVASLLEVGTGFHPELTGRENIFLNGAILGMTQREIRAKFDEIVAFAEVERFLDTPVKRYSSGMYVRLAFAVAAHLEPEILIVDEVLAVGDAEFQKKCLGKMSEVAGGGRTVLFVSHNLGAVQTLCERAILIANGQVAKEGLTAEVLKLYSDSNLTKRVSNGELNSFARKGEGKVRFQRVEFCDKAGGPLTSPATGSPLNITIQFDGSRTERRPARISITFYDVMEAPLFICTTEASFGKPLRIGAGDRINCKIARLPLSRGRYKINFFLEIDGIIEDWLQQYVTIDIVDGSFFGTTQNVPRGWEGKTVLVDNEWRRLSNEKKFDEIISVCRSREVS